MVPLRIVNKEEAANSTLRESGTLMRGPVFAALARDLGHGLRHLLEPGSLSGSSLDACRRAEVTALIDESESMARRFEAWVADPPAAADRIALVNRLASLKQRIGTSYA
jgi:hypothetical protein